MKTLFALLLASLCVCAVWFFATFTVFRAANDEGFLILYQKEAAECALSECAVYSEREFERTVYGILKRFGARPTQQSGRS